MEALVHWVYNSLLWKYFTLIPGEAGYMESERAMFKAYIVEVAATSCGRKINQRSIRIEM